MNSDLSTVAGYTPEFNITSGGDVISNGCFQSDKNGLSICILKAVSPGTRNMKISNIKQIDLEKSVTFTNIPINNNQLQIVADSDQKNSSAHYKMRGTIGHTTSVPQQATTHYTVYGSVQGAIIAGEPR